MVELKAVVALEDVHLAQGLNYLVAYKLDKGLLINFGAKSLEVKRLRHPKNKMPNTIPGNQSNNSLTRKLKIGQRSAEAGSINPIISQSNKSKFRQ